MQLLKITTIPIKYSIEIEDAKLKISEDTQGVDDVQSKSRQSVTRNSSKRMDVFSRTKDDGYHQMANLRMLAAQIASQGSQYQGDVEGVAPTSGSNVTAADVVRTKLLSGNREMLLLPDATPQVSFDSENFNMEYTPSDLDINWRIDPVDLDFVPGSFVVKIEQYPEIKIEYLGKPMYVPPSANPENEEPEK